MLIRSANQNPVRRSRVPWLAIRQDLPGWRRRLLVAMSFLVPLGLWCFVAYHPTLLKSSVEVRNSVQVQTGEALATFEAGRRVPIEYFHTLRDAVAKMNEQTLAAQQAGTSSADQPKVGHAQVAEGFQSGLAAMRAKKLAKEADTRQKRENLRILRQVGTIAIANGWVSPLPNAPTAEDFARFDGELLAVYHALASGQKVSRAVELGEENLDVIASNAALLPQPVEGKAFNVESLPAVPLMSMYPEGRAEIPILPAPHRVITTGWKMFTTPPAGNAPWLHERVVQSVSIVFMGFFFAAVIGVPVALLAGTYDLFSKLFEPFIDFFRYMPAPVFATLLVALLGAHDAPKVALVFIGTFFQLVLVVANTTRTLDKSLIEAARTLGARRAALLTRVIIPGVLPRLYNDLRILLGWAWTWLVIAELIGVKSGLTEVIDTNGTYRKFDHVYPMIILIGIIGFSTDQAAQVVARKLFPYEYERGGAVWFAWLGAVPRLWSRRAERGHALTPAVLPGSAQRSVDVASA